MVIIGLKAVRMNGTKATEPTNLRKPGLQKKLNGGQSHEKLFITYNNLIDPIWMPEIHGRPA